MLLHRDQKMLKYTLRVNASSHNPKIPVYNLYLCFQLDIVQLTILL